ncbi:hypothetical protein [Chryseobacterium sp.]|uniref:hypothetical protein n=1 Tax=Chryseobacterium sp. TaxID=1871047 RepID=UPI003219A65A
MMAFGDTAKKLLVHVGENNVNAAIVGVDLTRACLGGGTECSHWGAKGAVGHGY